MPAARRPPSRPAARAASIPSPGAVCELPGGDLWTREEPDGSVTVGLTRRGEERVGPIVHFRGPEPGQRFRKGEAAVSIESSKWVGHLAIPSSGMAAETNPAALADPGLINRDPEGAGWLYRFRPGRDAGPPAPPRAD